jgi:hypothetical protein
MNTIVRGASIDPVYRMERRRLLSNILCEKKLERRGFDTRPRGWHELGSKVTQRQLATLRTNWAGHAGGAS